MDKEDVAYINMVYYIKKSEILLFATRCMNPEDTMLSEISQRETSSGCYHLPMESKNKTSESTSHTETDSIENKIVVISGERKRGGPKQV